MFLDIMNRVLTFLFCFLTNIAFSQKDFSNKWEDFFSYNSVKDFIIVENKLFALTDNAVFTYNLNSKELKKMSSVNGLSGEATSAIHYNKKFKRLVIGYENGLLEVVDKKGNIHISPEIVNFNQTGLKKINAIYEYNNILYLATSFAIVEYNIEKQEFGDTFFIGAGSSSVSVNDIVVANKKIYATTENGIYTADINNPNLIEASNWSLQAVGDFRNIVSFNNKIYATFGNNLYELKNTSAIIVKTFSEKIINLSVNKKTLSVSLKGKAIFYDLGLNKITEKMGNAENMFTLQNARLHKNNIFLATKEYGILKTSLTSPEYKEIHPEGPLSNNVFSIDVKNQNIWVVYGGYNNVYTPSQVRQGFSYFNGNIWKNTPYNLSFPTGDLVDVAIDKNDNSNVFIAMLGDTKQVNTALTGGLLQLKNGKILNFYNSLNSPLEDIAKDDPNRITVRVPSITFDKKGNLWVTNIGAENRLKKLTPSGEWLGYNINELYQVNKYGMSEIVQDKSGNFWIGTRSNGVYVFNEKGNRKKALTTQPTKGSLPNANVRCIAVDSSNKVWIGTYNGLVTYSNPQNIFKSAVYDAKPIIILDEGIAKRLLGDQTINSIAIDGAGNKWFATENAGVMQTNSNGQKTMAIFNKDNSPLPDNRVLKIKIDNDTGKVYFATNKGIVAYKSNVAPYGETLKDVYAYPNPAFLKHDFVTIGGRNGNHLPKGTNVKILDASGNLVYETNTVESQESGGGKVVWNKRNLAGNKVASGIYIVLLSTEDNSETATAKIAIIN